MKRMLLSLVALLALAFCAACASLGGAPNVAAIQTACAADAAIRPDVSLLLPFATMQEAAAVTAARAVIDQVCANPSAPVETATAQAFSTATAQVIGFVVTMKARSAHPAPTPPASPASSVALAEIPRSA